MTRKRSMRRKSGIALSEATAPPAPTPRGKRILFRLLAVLLIPALGLAILELVLRVSGYGYATSFLLPETHRGEEVFVQNNQFGWRFFGPELSRHPNPLLISRKKSPDTIRIFVLGESAAKGDPDPRFGLARTLAATLSLRHPERKFEVINTGVTAINSHAILPIARDVARADGDIWVIYMGNNEVVGPFGAGTVFGSQSLPLPLIRSMLNFKTTRSGQWFDSFLSSGKSDDTATEWQGMEMFLEQRIRFADARLAGVYHNFDRNLRDILRVGKRAGVGIVLSTAAVNLKDCAPFGSSHRNDLSPAQLATWTNAFEKGVQAQAQDDFSAALGHFRQALEIDDAFAELHFRMGQCQLATGELATAQQSFAAARDLDTLRFRTDSKLNDAIRKVGSDTSSSAVRLADAEHAIAEQSAAGIPGAEWFYEHVHLTFEGNCLLARILAEQIEVLLTSRFSIQPEPHQPWPTPAECAARLGWSEYHRHAGWKRISPRLQRPPFTGQFDHERRMKQVQETLSELSPATRPAGIRPALEACETALNSTPHDADLLFQLAQFKRLTGDLPGAIAASQRALEELPSDSEGWLQLGMLLARARQFDAAANAFQSAIKLDSRNVVAQDGLAQAYSAVGKQKEAIAVLRRLLAQNPQLGLVWLHLGQILERSGATEEANASFEKAFANAGANLAGLLELAEFCQNRRWFDRAATLYERALQQDTGNAELHVGAGQNFAALNQLEKAAHHSAQAIKLAPEFAEAHLLHGTIMGRRNDMPRAREAFQTAVQLDPELIPARVNLGITLMKEQPAVALEQFEAVLKLNPTNTTALKYAAELRRWLENSSPIPQP